MLRAIIFDFNGIILDDEPLHFRSMRDTVLEFGVVLTQEEYWNKYLPLDDRQCLAAICHDYSVQLSTDELERALTCKSELYRRLLQDRFPLFPGAAEFIEAAAALYPLALASGARRREIEATLSATGLGRYFSVVVAAEDFVRGKPSPESFLLALERLNAANTGQLEPIRACDCLVIEDSVGGVRGARAAGMICLAVTNSYPSEELLEANRVVASFEEVELASLHSLFQEFV